jgi:3-phosphoglycerate kinase
LFAKKTIRDVDVQDKTVLVHGEFDAPLTDDGQKVASDFRIASCIPTIQYLQEQGCRIVLISKLGRPDGVINPKMSLKPVAECLAKLMDQEVAFVHDCIGDEVKQACAQLQPGKLLMLENLRFYPEEEQNDLGFARHIASDTGAQIFVDDCFALAHREEAGNSAITRCVPVSVAGLHLAKEVDIITEAMENPQRPLMAVVGGAKISDKIEFLYRFIDIADVIAIGGAMANTFLAAKGIDIAESLYEKDDIGIAKEIMDKAADKARKQPFVFALPYDGVVARKIDKLAPTRIIDWSAHVIASIENYPKRPPHAASQIKDDEHILDIGPFTGSFYAGAMQLASTVIWNGSMGVTEQAGTQGPVGPYSHGTELMVEAMLGQFGHRPFSLVGGGDTVGYVEARGLVKAFDHVSTGGGASLELMAGHTLPGVEALQDK